MPAPRSGGAGAFLRGGGTETSVPSFARLRRGFERLLEAVVGIQMVALTAIVVIAVVYRKSGNSLSWYDEVASIQLAWLTYYGAALAALKRAHIGFEGIIEAVPPRLGLFLLAIGEAGILGFFVLLAWVGWRVLLVLEGETLVSLPSVPVQLTQSVIPVGAALFVVAQLMSLPEVWGKIRRGEKLNADVRGEPAPGAADGGAQP